MGAHKHHPLPRRVGFALHGLAHALSSEASLRFQAVVALIVLAVLLMLRPAPAWWALLTLVTALVFAAELLNTAIETLADALHPNDSPAIRIVKDCAAAAVLVSVVGAFGVAAAFAVHLLTE
jgi:undecaprenol kinase